MIAGVLLMALDDARRGGRRQQDAEAWLASDVRDRVTCFVRVCETLDLDVSMVRRAVRNGSGRLPPGGQGGGVEPPAGDVVRRSPASWTPEGGKAGRTGEVAGEVGGPLPGKKKGNRNYAIPLVIW